ncbi:MAG: metallophosphoesterase family protein [Anaerostipes hadrus]
MIRKQVIFEIYSYCGCSLGSQTRERADIWKDQRTRDQETFQRVIDHANKQQVDLLLIAGDLFDQPPTQQELREVDYLLSRLNHTRTVLIAGNHDHLEPHDVFFSINGIRKFTFWMENKEIIFLLKILKRLFMALVIGRSRSRNHCMIA